jgi:hypothetical protein
VHEDEERAAALDPGSSDQPSTAASQADADAAWPFPTAASVAVAGAVAPTGSCRYLYLGSGAASCLALAPVVAISTRQVELMCLGPAHAHCPRFVHGGTGERPLPAPTLRPSTVAVATTVRRDAFTDDSESALAPSGSWLEAAGVAISTDDLGTTTAIPDPEPDAESAPERDDEGQPEDDRSTESAPQAPAEPTDFDDEAPAPTADGRSRPDDASDTEGLAGLAAAAAAAAPGAIETDAGSAPAPDSAPRTTPVRGRTRPRADGLRMSQAHERSIALRPSIIVATLVLAGAIVAAFAFVAARGGLVLPQVGSPSASLVAAASQPAPSGPPPSAPPSAPPAASPSPAATSTAAPSATPSRTAAASPSPVASSPGSPWTAAQLAVLKPCPGRSGCWQYKIHSGDNLHGVAKFFGIAYPALLAANPQIKNSSLIHVGEVIVVPAPGA